MSKIPCLGALACHWWGGWYGRYGIILIMLTVLVSTGCGKDPEQQYEPLSPLPLRVGGSGVVTPSPIPEVTQPPAGTPEALVQSNSTEVAPIEPPPLATPTATPVITGNSDTKTPKPASVTPTPTPTLTPTPTPQKTPAPKPQASEISEKPEKVTVSQEVAALDTLAQNEKETDRESGDEPKQEEHEPIVMPYDLTIDKLLVCAKVKDRVPGGCEENFSLAETGKVFTWMKVSDVKAPKILKHVYFWEDKKIATVTLNLKYTTMRTWSQKTFKPDQVGNWKVVVMTKDDEVIASRSWTVNP